MEESKICETLTGYGAFCAPTTLHTVITPKYNRIKQKSGSIKRDAILINSSSEEELEEYSEISSSNDNPSNDDDVLIEKMLRLTGNPVKNLILTLNKNFTDICISLK